MVGLVGDGKIRYFFPLVQGTSMYSLSLMTSPITIYCERITRHTDHDTTILLSPFWWWFTRLSYFQCVLLYEH